MSNEMNDKFDYPNLNEIIQAAKVIAKQYRQLTRKPLGITGEIGELTAANILGLTLTPARQPGYDAIRLDGSIETKIQIKSRVVLDGANRGQRLGRIRLDREWDSVILVLLDEDFEPLKIYEANRLKVTEALLEPGSKARERGALSIGKFKSIAELVWEKGLNSTPSSESQI